MEKRWFKHPAITLAECYSEFDTPNYRRCLEINSHLFLCYSFADLTSLTLFLLFLWCPSNRCENKTLCLEKLSLVLLETPPFMPRQYGRCAVIGNSGDLLKTNFGEEIDGYDAVFRENGAPIQV